MHARYEQGGANMKGGGSTEAHTGTMQKIGEGVERMYRWMMSEDIGGVYPERATDCHSYRLTRPREN